MRIAILGGSFDPIHKGHLQIAKQALKQLHIEEVWFMPSKDTPLRSNQMASFHDRCVMIKRTIHPYRHMRLCQMENTFDGCSYTIQTVKALCTRYPNDSFCWLIGDDQALQFDAWKEADALRKMIPFYVFRRGEQTHTLPWGLHRVVMPLLDVSSSEIRKGQKLHCLAKGVMKYIGEQGLYIESMVQERMNAHRFQHSKSVATLCVEFARSHQLDEHCAYLMGITHDVCKQLPLAQAERWIQNQEPQRMDEAKALWHSYIGASYIRRVFHIYDRRISEAVYHHVIGRNRTDYDRILYIADKLDPARGYDSSKEIAMAKRDLKEAFVVVKQQQQAYLQEAGTLHKGEQ